MDWIGLDWIGLDWIGLDWIGWMDWIWRPAIHNKAAAALRRYGAGTDASCHVGVGTVCTYSISRHHCGGGPGDSQTTGNFTVE